MADTLSSSGVAVTAADFSDIRWRGNWIWCEPSAPPRGIPGLERAVADRPEVHGLFRKTFTLDTVPGKAPARITADSRYLLYLNGREVFRGPIRSQPRRTLDMIFYTLGVTPAEPGYTTARVAPNLGDLAWAEGKVPTPHGLISARVEPGRLLVESPVPLVVEFAGKVLNLPAGKHEIK